MMRVSKSSKEGDVAEYVLEMTNISKSFTGVKVLNNVQLHVKKGEVHALMGENGAGKSTLMNILMGIHQAEEGMILMDGQQLINKNPKEAMDNKISMIHQELNPILDMDVAENIFIGREIKRGTDGIFSLVNKKKMREEARKLLKQLGLEIEPTTLIRDLSVAQCQLIEIIKAISIDSKIVIMDEPTSAITDKEVDILFQQIRKLKESGVAVIYISHKMDEIFQIADSITVLRDGTFVGTDSAKNLDNDKLIKMMVGREITEVFPKLEVDIGDEILEVKGYTWGKRVKDVSFSLKKGEILGIAGLVGAGRSELVETLFGINKKDSGDLWIHGKMAYIKSPADAIRMKMALVTEDRKQTGLNLSGTVEENIVIAAMDRLFEKGIIDWTLEGKVAEESIKNMNVKTTSRKVNMDSLSGGNQQKVVIAKWLLTEPDIIILDEPTRGIDVGAKREIYILLGELVKAGKAVIVISSEIPEIMGVADRILVMAEGRVTGELERSDFTQERIMHYASQFNGGTDSE